MLRNVMAYAGGKDGQPLAIPFLISLLGHALVFGLFIYTPKSDPSRFNMSSVMQVQMVDLGGGGPAETTRTVDSPKETDTAPVKELSPVQETKQSIAAPTPSREAPPAEVSLAPQTPKAKTALKYQTMRPRETPKAPPAPPAPQRAESRPAPQPVNPLQETIRRLREQVEKDGPPSTTGGGQGSGQGTAAGGGGGGFGIGGSQKIEAIDLYRLEVAFAIQKNWAFAEQLGGGRGDRIASIVFKVLPDGRIEDIFFTDRSGDPYLDESGYRAIVKSSPVRPHPNELRQPYIEMGLRFTPKGIQ